MHIQHCRHFELAYFWHNFGYMKSSIGNSNWNCRMLQAGLWPVDICRLKRLRMESHIHDSANVYSNTPPLSELTAELSWSGLECVRKNDLVHSHLFWLNLVYWSLLLTDSLHMFPECPTLPAIIPNDFPFSNREGWSILSTRGGPSLCCGSPASSCKDSVEYVEHPKQEIPKGWIWDCFIGILITWKEWLEWLVQLQNWVSSLGPLEQTSAHSEMLDEKLPWCTRLMKKAEAEPWNRVLPQSRNIGRSESGSNLMFCGYTPRSILQKAMV